MSEWTEERVKGLLAQTHPKSIEASMLREILRLREEIDRAIALGHLSERVAVRHKVLDLPRPSVCERFQRQIVDWLDARNREPYVPIDIVGEARRDGMEEAAKILEGMETGGIPSLYYFKRDGAAKIREAAKGDGK